MELVSAHSRLFSTTELRLSTILRECSAINYALCGYEFLVQGSKHPIILYTDHKPILFYLLQKNKPSHRVYIFQLFLMKFPNLQIVWTEGRSFSLPDLSSRSLTTTTQDEYRLRTVEIPKNIKFVITHNPSTQPIQCNYAVSKKYITSVSTDTIVESPNFPIYLQIKDNYFKFQLENYLYLPVSHHEFQTKVQPIEQINQQRFQHLKNNHCPTRNLSYYTTHRCNAKYKQNRTIYATPPRCKLCRIN